MKIYILRHEDRTIDCSFFAPLTLKGLQNSQKLIPILKDCNINLIFSSPFIRTLQTIYPYVKTNKFKINVEYGLSELHHQDIIPKNAVGVNLPEYIAELFNYDSKYKSIINSQDIKYPESMSESAQRTIKFIRELIEKYYTTDFNIVLVSHQAICINILKLVNKKYKNINTDSYEKGKLCLIFNKNDWDYQKIN